MPRQLSDFLSQAHKPFHLGSVKNYEVSEIFLAANKLASYSFMDIGRRYEIPKGQKALLLMA